MLLDPSAGAPTIAQDGMISQEGRSIGAVGLYAIDANAKLTRYDNSAVLSDLPGAAVLDFTSNGVMQGMSEGSNVNAVLEMTKMIAVSRSFDSAGNAIQSTENSLQDAIKTLGATS
jgi:flagellar basal-body rod protein FlgF